MCITMRKVVLHDILRRKVQKFYHMLWPSWRPSWRLSWISRLAQGFSLAIRLIFIKDVLMV